VEYGNAMGLIAGGQEDGAVTIWEPTKIDQEHNDQLKMGRGCVSVAEVHRGQKTNCVAFSPFKKNLLATGGEEVLILDIAQNIKKPMQFKPGVPNHHQGSYVTSISWNCTVPHILASASANGKICVWDMKSSKAIFNFTEGGAT
jgi:protein transport protein SEC31